MILHQTLKYFILDTCINTFFDKFQHNLRISIPPVITPIIGTRYKEIIGPNGEHFRNMICKQIINTNDIRSMFILNLFYEDNEFLYMFSKEDNSNSINNIFIELIISENKLIQWILIS